ASHLVLYRVVAYYLMPTREAVHDLASLLQFLVTSYCQLLRISGQFHLAIGILCLFGWNLPRPQYLYFLASGFADYWRRANVYWRDFMVELFLYPAFQRLRRRGVAQPLFLATCWVFVATWLLHAWQWFWLLGRVRLGLVDALFWGAFGLAVAVNALLESRRRARPDPRAPRQCLRHAVKVLLTFAATCLLWSLWTSESVGAWLATLARGRVASPEQLAAVAAGVALLVGGGAAVTWTLRNRPAAEPAAPDSWRWRRAAVTGSAAAAFALLGFSPFQVRLPAPATQLLFSLTEARFAQREADRARAGYYEELQETPRLSERHWFYRAKRWRDRRADPVVEQDGYLRRALRPSVSTVYQGKSFRSNAWGMRDRDYALRKAAGTFRIAVVGPSDAMGYGVADAEVFEHRLEERLSRDHAGGRWAAYEVLNHSIPGLGPLEAVHVVRDQALRFAPDLLLVVLHQGDERRAAQDLVRWHRLGLALPEHLRPHTAEIDLADTRPLRAAAQQIAGSGVDLVDWALGEIAGTARAAGARPVAVLFPNLAQSPDDEPLERIADTAARHGFLVVDLSGLFADERHEVLFATPWDHHPGAAAHARLAAALYEALRRHDPLLGAGLAAAPEDFAGGAP
ncbi:MAG TPA: hypothetical protein VMT16_13495, partial [Thermoanaerobaculia bacterium]|nr:hypothetical protein [Thermoanaerobaculia bacterium]